jgi:hypothetical protein
MQAVLRDRPTMERLASEVNDFLGNYMTFTARERRVFARVPMFYGFLRFSLRFTFYTMPVKHPVMTSIISELGRLETEEVRTLLGGDELPWAMGRFFFTKGGKLQSIDVSRANPFLNQVTQLNTEKGPRAPLLAAMRSLPPYVVSLANITFAKSSFEDKDYATDGRSRQQTAKEGITTGQAGRIFLGEMLRLSAIYREIEKGVEQGAPHGADSLLGDRPTKFKRPNILAGIEESRAKFEDRGGFGGSLKRGFLPLLPREDDSKDIAQKVRESRGQKKPAAPLTPEQQRLVDAYSSTGPAIDQKEIDRLLKAYSP